MSRPTLLDLTQRILSAMDSDVVNHIGDTAEASQVADVIRETYLDIIDEYDLKAKHTVFQLNASGTTARPTDMSLPEGYHSIEWIKYDNRIDLATTTRNYVTLQRLEPDEFINLCNYRSSNDATVTVVVDPSGVEFLIKNNTNPSYYTSLDGRVFIFDSYDSSIDSTLQSSKTQVYGQVTNDLTIADTTVIDLPQELYNLLRNQARETCFELFKGGAPSKLVKMSNRSRIRVGRLKNPQRDQIPTNFGRK